MLICYALVLTHFSTPLDDARLKIWFLSWIDLSISRIVRDNTDLETGSKLVAK